MICSANLLVLASMLATPVRDSVPAALVLRVRTEFATRWKIDTADVRLEWGLWGAADTSVALAPYSITGGANDGWYAVIMEPHGGLPHAVRVHAGVARPVTVAARPLTVGQKLDASDVLSTTGIVWGAPKPVEVRSYIGWEARRAIKLGEVLLVGAVSPPVVINTGQTVMMTWGSAGVHVEREGVAIQQARLGDPVRLRAGTSEIAAIATGPGAARVVGKAP